MVKRLWEWSVVQAESMAETGIVTGLLAAPLLGVVTKEDADSAVVIDMARNILGNPYGDESDGAPTPCPPVQTTPAPADHPASQPAADGSVASDGTQGVPDGGVDSSPTSSAAEDGVGSEATGAETAPE